MSSKVSLDERDLAKMMLKVKRGLCCLEDCQETAELMYGSTYPPYLCEHHIQNPSDDAHPGDYSSVDRAYRTGAVISGPAAARRGGFRTALSSPAPLMPFLRRSPCLRSRDSDWRLRREPPRRPGERGREKRRSRWPQTTIAGTGPRHPDSSSKC